MLITDQINKKRNKPIDEIKPAEDDCPKEGPKLKKLTWQSSITSGNKTESTLTGPRVLDCLF